MPIIDSDGLSHGKRLRRCSDKARLYWPYLFCQSNGYGRFEIDYELIVATVFLGFSEPPGKVEFVTAIQEYAANRLLFVYESGGELWGQWDTKDKYLKRHKTASDRESPIPPEPQFTQWKKEINENKGLPKVSAVLNGKLHGIGEGVGVGVGVGVGENLSASQANAGTVDAPHSRQIETPKAGDALLSSTDEAPALPGALLSSHVEAPAPSRKKNRDVLTPWQREKFDAIWAIYWRKRDKAASEKAFAVKVKTEELYAKVRAAVVAQTPEMLTREPQHRPYFATWLHKARWEDEPEAGAVGPEDPIDRAKREYIARQKEAKK